MVDITTRANVSVGLDISKVLSGVKAMQGAFSGLKLPANLTGDTLKEFEKLQSLLKDYKRESDRTKDGPISKDANKNLKQLEKAIESSFSRLAHLQDEFNGRTIMTKADTKALDDLIAKTREAQTAYNNAFSGINIKKGTNLGSLVSDLDKAAGRAKTLKDGFKEAFSSLESGDISKYTNQVNQMVSNVQKRLEKQQLKTPVENIIKQFQNIGVLGKKIDLSTPEAQAKALQKALIEVGKEASKTVNTDGYKALATSLQEAEKAEENFRKAAQQRGQEAFNTNVVGQIDRLGNGFHQGAQAAQEFRQATLSASQQVEQLQQSTQYFFSLRNMINLLKRGIDQAVQSVKDLDKAMTETAVVTDFDVSDMWAKLPEYTKLANELGATTQGAYETMTLYYQQGLDTQQSFAIGAETMKMARIAGLEYKDATDMMTAALRGFNMELDETSAKNVNDVYSELAAITASDTRELGEAMERTASIAHSAGMSFEGTTAFLAQMIETTREAPENLGTAMKTIVARFQELKKNPLEISEVDGEEVSYNKIDTALKTIGVDLKDTNGQFRELDQVFLDISAKWDSLSQTQQRYIATTAAGSRQQSRFIAMMNNHERTVQLMEAANNSAGASDEQFGKTMESLEAKLNKLHNAWQEFTMGIANNTMIKGAVDGMTGFLNTVNKIIDALSLGIGPIKSFLSIFTAFTGLKFGGRILNQLIGGLGGLVDPTSTFKQGFKGGALGGKSSNQAKAISQPIVSVLTKISGQIAALKAGKLDNDFDPQGNQLKTTSKNEYLQARKDFEKLSTKQGFKIGEASNIFKTLDNKSQLSLFNNSPGTKQAMKQSSLKWVESLGLSEAFTKEGKIYVSSIYKGMEEGKISVDKGINLIGQPAAWGKYFGTDMAKNISSSYINTLKANTQQAHENTLYSLGLNPKDYKVGSDELKNLLKEDSELRKTYAQNYKDWKDSNSLKEVTGSVSSIGKFSNEVGAIADKFTQAGYGITAFGGLLAQLGGPIGAVGTGIQGLGGIISSLGMSVSGATGLISIFTHGLRDAESAVLVSGSTIATIVGPIAALGAALFIAHKHLKNIKEAGEKVTTTFSENSKSAEGNISKLKAYKEELAILSKGVDKNGNNINLDESQYQRYLEIVNDIAAINPSIVKGYNAQGHAIIDNNTALTETLKLQEEIKQQTYDAYTSQLSLQKLINARNIDSKYKKAAQTQENGVNLGYGHGNEGRAAGIGNAVPLAGDVSSIADKLRLLNGFDPSSLEKYGIESLDSLINGEEQAVKNFIKHRDKIAADLSNSGLELNKGILKGFEKLGKDTEAFEEAVKPVFDNLLTQVSQSSLYESVSDDFKDALSIGLKDLASQDLDASEMSSAANNMVARFASLSSGSGKYQEALDKVTDAQNEFATTLNETEYKANVEPAIQDLKRLKEEALEEGSTYGNALAEFLENQIQRISNFTKAGAESLSSALNTAKDDITAAENALESFNEATKTDYATAAEGMRSIYDKITETYKDSFGTELKKHSDGNGDQTFWTGAETLLGKDTIKNKSASQVSKMLKEFEPMLREGREGFDAFYWKVTESREALEKLDGVELDDNGWFKHIPDEQWHNVAVALGMSDEMLTSMLNKGRQFADINFMNVDDARKALATSDMSVKGTTAEKGEEQTVYVKEEALRSQLAEENIRNEDEQNKHIEALAEKGVKIIPPADSLKKSDLSAMANDWGVKTLPDLITTLNATGTFTKDEIKAYADKLGLVENEEEYDEAYDDTIQQLENPELTKQTAELSTISGYTSEIRSLLARNRVEEGHLDNPMGEAGKELLTGNTLARDTKFERFGLNQDENGNTLSDQEYSKTRTQLQGIVKDWESYLGSVEQGIKAAHDKGDAKAEESLKAEKQAVEENIATAKKFLEEAKESKKHTEALAKAEEQVRKQRDAESKALSHDTNQDRRKAKKHIPDSNEPTALKSPTQPAKKSEDSDVTITYNAKETSEAKKTAQKAKELADQDGKEYTVTTNYKLKESSGNKKVYQKQQRLAEQNGEEFTTTLKTEGETEGAEEVQEEVKNTKDKIVKISTIGDPSGAITVRNAVNSVPSTKTSHVDVSTGGAMGKLQALMNKMDAVARKGQALKNGGAGAAGINNNISKSIPTFQSAAKGMLGPENKGGATLTGEEGFEVVWLPSEGRSIIVGTLGPQMLNLPADAVVYNHKQSKKILGGKGIPAGSLTTGNSKSYTPKYPKNSSSGNGSGGSSRAGKKSNSSKSEKSSKKASKAAARLVWWWDQMAHKMDKVSKQADKLNKQLEKMISDIRMTETDIKKVNDKYVKALELQKKLANQELKRAKQALSNSSKLYSSDSKKAKKQKKTAANERKVDVTIGKKEKTINAKKFIKKDEETGEWVVNVSKIKKSYKKGADRKSVYDAVESWLKDIISKRNSAEDTIENADEQIRDMDLKIRNMFYGWKNELTQVYSLTKQIDLLQAKLSNTMKRISLAQDKISDFNWITGDQKKLDINISTFMKNYDIAMEQNREISGKADELLEAYKKEKEEFLTPVDDARLSIINSREWGYLDDQEKRDYARNELISQYLNSEGIFDVDKFERNRKDGLITSEKANLIKEAFDELQELSIGQEEAEGQILDIEQDMYDLEKQRTDLAKTLGEELYGWKNELTKIWNLTQQISNTEKQISRFREYNKLLEAQLGAGLEKNIEDISSRLLGFFNAQLIATNNSLKERAEAIGTQITDIQHTWNLDFLKSEYTSVEDKYNKATNARALKAAQEAAQAAAQAAASAASSASAQNASLQSDLQAAQSTKDEANSALSSAKGKEAAGQTLVDKGNEIRSNTKNKTKVADANSMVTQGMTMQKEAASAISSAEVAVKNAESAISSISSAIAQNNAIIAQNATYQSQLSSATAAFNAVAQDYLDDKAYLELEGRRQLLEEELTAKNKAHEYLVAYDNGDGTYDFDINHEKIEADRQKGALSATMYNAIKDYLEELIDQVGQLQDLYLEQTQMLTELYTMLSELKENYAKDSEELLAAYVELRDKELSQIKTLSDSINNTLKDILSDVNKLLSQRRQAEDNRKTEADIIKKQNRLTALRGNTGRNSVNILQLQQEISDAQLSYGRTLEDQLVNRIQTNADIANKQRQRQIDLLSGILEQNKVNGVNVDYIKQLLADPTRHQETIQGLWEFKNNYVQATEAQKEILTNQFNTFMEELLTLPEKIAMANIAAQEAEEQKKLLEAQLKAAEEAQKAAQKTPVAYDNWGGTNIVSSVTPSVQSYTATTPTVVYTGYSTTSTKDKKASTKMVSATSTVSQADAEAKAKGFTDYVDKAASNGKTSVKELNNVIAAGAEIGLSKAESIESLVKTTGISWDKIIKVASDAGMSKKDVQTLVEGTDQANSSKYKKAVKKYYATGGLADYTGPAWLDGTPSKPELVLNAKDTKNFIALKDILSHVMSSASTLGLNTDNPVEYNYEININVDHIANDYDVDKVAERVKKIIVKDSTYRNVTQVRKFR